MNLQTRFATNVLILRKKRNLSQKDLADKIGISISYVSMLEHGQRSPEHLRRVTVQGDREELAAAIRDFEPVGGLAGGDTADVERARRLQGALDQCLLHPNS